MWKDALIGLGVAIVASWFALAIALVLIRPKGNVLREAVRILPDLIRLLKNLAADRTQPGPVRIRLGLLMAYLAIPSTSSPTSSLSSVTRTTPSSSRPSSAPSSDESVSTKSVPTGRAPTTASPLSAKPPASPPDQTSYIPGRGSGHNRSFTRSPACSLTESIRSLHRSTRVQPPALGAAHPKRNQRRDWMVVVLITSRNDSTTRGVCGRLR